MQFHEVLSFLCFSKTNSEGFRSWKWQPLYYSYKPECHRCGSSLAVGHVPATDVTRVRIPAAAPLFSHFARVGCGGVRRCSKICGFLAPFASLKDPGCRTLFLMS